MVVAFAMYYLCGYSHVREQFHWESDGTVGTLSDNPLRLSWHRHISQHRAPPLTIPTGRCPAITLYPSVLLPLHSNINHCQSRTDGSRQPTAAAVGSSGQEQTSTLSDVIQGAVLPDFQIQIKLLIM